MFSPAAWKELELAEDKTGRRQDNSIETKTKRLVSYLSKHATHTTEIPPSPAKTLVFWSMPLCRPDYMKASDLLEWAPRAPTG